MQTFLFVVGISGQFERHLELICERATPLIPGFAGTKSTTIQVLPEVTGGWVSWRDAAAPMALVSHEVRDDLAVLAFGELSDGTHAAHRVAAEFRNGGIDKARSLNGTFCAIITERRERRIQVISDRVGRLAASCWANAGRLHVTVHEVLLGVCGCPFDLDPVAAASVVGCGWSMAGVPLNRNVARIDGRRKAAWSNGVFQILDLPLFGPHARVDVKDEGAIRDVVGSMCETVTRAAEARARATTQVEAGLTAGLDSRAVLAALLSGFEKEQVRLYTTGGPNSRDSRVASQIADYLRLHHEQRPFEAPSSEDFQAHDSLRAFMANGDTNSRGSLMPIPKVRRPGEIVAGGGGGEIFRGFYYRIAGDAVGEKQVVKRLCARKFVRLSKLGMRTEVVEGVTQRIEQCFQSYSALSRSREDWLDLFYLHERFAHFAAPSARKQDAPRWLPFADTELLELAWRLPAPIGTHCDVHKQLIRRFLPNRLYWTPLNGKHPPALEGNERTKKFLRDVAFALGYARKRLSRPTTDGASAPTAESLFATAVYDYVRDLLHREGGIALTLLGSALLSKVLDEHRNRHNQMEALGSLVNMEHYRQLCTRAFEGRITE